MSFGQDLAGFVISNLATYTSDIFHALASSWPALSFTTLYIVIVGYKIIKGDAGAHAKELAASVILLLVLHGAMGAGFDEWIARPFLDTVQGLSQLALSTSGNSGGDVFVQLDDGLAQVMTAIDRLEPTGSFLTNAWLYIKLGGVSFLLAIAFGLLYLVYLVLYIAAYFSIYMMLMVGGVFIWLAAFRSGRAYTYAWLKALLHYGLWLFFLSAVMGFFMGVVIGYVHDLGQWDVAIQGPFPASAGKLIFLCLLTAWLLLKTAEWSASLTGGTAMSPGIVTSGTNMLGGALSSAARSKPVSNAINQGVGGAASLARGGAVRAYSALKGVK